MAEARTRDSHADVLPTDALKEAGQQLLTLLAQRAAQAATDRVTDLTGKLSGIAENGGTGVLSAFRGEKDDDDDRRRSDEDSDDGDGDGDGEERRSGIGGFFGNLKDKVAGLFGGGGGGGGGGKGKKLKVTVISESLDVGLPLRTTYNLWTQYEDFPSFMKKVETVDFDDEKSTWKAQVFWSHREWQASTVEQVADSHIVWKSTGAKGHVDGAVTFTSLGPNLTRVLLVMEYYPQGLFERTGNIWRAQGRRARLEFQHFRRHAMTQAILNQDDIEGWRGEIRDGEVVTTHEEALEQEQSQATEQDDSAAAAAESGDEDERVDDEAMDEAGEADEAAADESEEDEGDEEPVDEADDYAEDSADEDAEPSDEYEDADDYDDEADEADEDAEPVDEYEESDDEEYDEPDDDEPVDEADDYDEPEDDSEGRGSDGDGSSRRRQPVGARSGRRR